MNQRKPEPAAMEAHLKVRNGNFLQRLALVVLGVVTGGGVSAFVNNGPLGHRHIVGSQDARHFSVPGWEPVNVTVHVDGTAEVLYRRLE